jgi:electron transfer flavoprotein alpha/beta subunit
MPTLRQPKVTGFKSIADAEKKSVKQVSASSLGVIPFCPPSVCGQNACLPKADFAAAQWVSDRFWETSGACLEILVAD